MIKKLLLLFFVSVVSALASAQPTEVPKNYVLFEITTGTWCGYCPGAAMAADEMVAEGLNVAIIENHGGDAYETTGSEARNDFYSVTAYPTTRFNGTEVHVGGGTESMYPLYKEKYDKLVNELTPYTLNLETQNLGNNEYNISVLSNQLISKAEDSVRLFVVITESHIPESWMGQTEVNFVNRNIVNSDTGTYICYSCSGTFYEVFDFNIPETWNKDNIEIVAFLQEMNSLEVVQTNKTILPQQQINYDIGIIEMLDQYDAQCGNTMSPKVKIVNNGQQILESAVFNYHVNSESIYSFVWTGNMAVGEIAEVQLPEIEFTGVNGNNTIYVDVSQPNNEDDEVPGNNSIQNSFIQTWQKNRFLQIQVATDYYGEETSWELLNDNDEVVLSGHNYSSGAEYNSYFEPENNACYTFKAYDAGGNGIDEGGFIRLIDFYSQHLIADINSFAAEYTLEFGTNYTFEPSLGLKNSHGNPVSKADTVIVECYSEDSLIIVPFDIINKTPLQQHVQLKSEIVEGSLDLATAFLWNGEEQQNQGDSILIAGLDKIENFDLRFRPQNKTGEWVIKYNIWVDEDSTDNFEWYVRFKSEATPPVIFDLYTQDSKYIDSGDTLTVQDYTMNLTENVTKVYLNNSSQINVSVNVQSEITTQGGQHSSAFTWNSNEYPIGETPSEAIDLASGDTLKSFGCLFNSNNKVGETIIKYTLFNASDFEDKETFYIKYIANANPYFDLVISCNQDEILYGDTVSYVIKDNEESAVQSRFEIENKGNYSLNLKLKRSILQGLGALIDSTYWNGETYLGANKEFPGSVPLNKNEAYHDCKLSFYPPFSKGNYLIRMEFFDKEHRDSLLMFYVNYSVQEATAVDAIKIESTGFIIYPNPVQNYIQIKPEKLVSAEDWLVEIFTLEGSLIYHSTKHLSKKENILINANGWDAGVYLIKMKSKDDYWQGKLLLK